MIIDNKFDIADIAYLITDVDQAERIVTGFRVHKHDILYELCCGDDESIHYDFEISTEKKWK